MVLNSSALYARVSPDIKFGFEEICREYGTTSSQALRDFVTYVCIHSEFPIEVSKVVSSLEIMEKAVSYFISEYGDNCIIRSVDFLNFVKNNYGEGTPVPLLQSFCYNVCSVGFVNPKENRLLEMVDIGKYKCLGHIDDYTGPVYRSNLHGFKYIQIGEFNNGEFRLLTALDFQKHGDRFAPWAQVTIIDKFDKLRNLSYLPLKRSFLNFLRQGGRSEVDARTLASDAFYMYRALKQEKNEAKFWDLLESKNPDKMYEAFVQHQIGRGRESSSPSYASYRRAFHYLYRFIDTLNLKS